MRQACATDGLSPRGRGKHFSPHRATAADRSIPAWAGETGNDAGAYHRDRVYPRVGGGNRQNHIFPLPKRGLSPRGRGKRDSRRRAEPARRSIPAWAGETNCSPIWAKARAVYPRVGGGNLIVTPKGLPVAGLSPRGRGKPVAAAVSVSIRGSIPAWAGETLYIYFMRLVWRVYPRVGGGNPGGRVRHSRIHGLSPRGRGKPVRQAAHSAFMGSIPAWAGETGDAGPLQPPHEVYPRVGGGNAPPMLPSGFGLGLSPRGRGKPR